MLVVKPEKYTKIVIPVTGHYTRFIPDFNSNYSGDLTSD